MKLSLSDAKLVLAALAAIERIADKINTLGEMMATVNEQLTALRTQFSDTTADVRARLTELNSKVDTLTAQLGTLDPEAQATLDAIKADVQALDDAVGDADGSDNPPPPVV